MAKSSTKIINDATGMLVFGLLLFFVVPGLLAHFYPEDSGGSFFTRLVGTGCAELVGALSIAVSTTALCVRLARKKMSRNK
jgi:hypothetical protein